MEIKILVLVLVCVVSITPTAVKGWWGASVFSIRRKIADTANRKVGLTHWSYLSSCCHGTKTNKCNYFVYDVGKEAGAKMPTRSWWRGPVGAGSGGWGDKTSSLKYWSVVSSPQRGDIIAAHKNGVYHVGIYVGNRKSVSANRYNVGKNGFPKWGGYAYQGIVYWRYVG